MKRESKFHYVSDLVLKKALCNVRGNFWFATKNEKRDVTCANCLRMLERADEKLVDAEAPK